MSLLHGEESAEERSAEDALETKLRPQRLSDFQGQAELKQNLGVFVQAARERDEALDHVFLSGPPGLGKTTLASILAHEMATEFKVTSAPALEKPKDLAGILTTITEGTVFLIDEIHRLKPAIEEMLYIAMEDYELDWIIGQGPAARTIRIPLPPFTLVGATTKAGLVAAPLYSRFGITVRINYYSLADLASIIERSATILGVSVNADAVELLARCARGTPRVANRILRRMRDFAQVLGDGVITESIVSEGMGRLRIDPEGLEEHDRAILRTVITTYGGGPVGAETLAISVGEAIDTLEDFYEPYLIQCGYLKRTPRGRVATPRAYEHLGLELPRENDGLLF
ncbi:MAG: Holliday junction branch migration DNA helicase RuvB [Spirochaetota bacterium]